MKPETHFVPEARLEGGTRTGLLILSAGLVTVAILAIYWPTAQSIEAIWRRSETFAHGYIVIPIVLWLVWRKREGLAHLAPRPYWPALAVVMLAGAAWLAGNVAGVLGLEQLALLVMVEAALVAVLGLAIARQLAFPLLFLFFAIPLGEVLVPWLIDRTADFTVTAIRLSGVPVYREGNHLAIPTGRWSVVEACSGIRYLIASMMAGTLYAYLFYRSTRKRALFVAVSIVVPIVANWLRAYLIVMLGHLSNNKLAAGVDHIIYGWVFFGAVILIMFWIGARWREDEASPAVRRSPWLTRYEAGPARAGALALAAVIAVALAAVWRPLEAAIDSLPVASVRALPDVAAVAGWTEAAPIRPLWTPHFKGARSERHRFFAKDGAVVGLYVALYAQQTQGTELVGSQNQLVTPSDPYWIKAESGRERIVWNGAELAVDSAEVRGGSAQVLAARSWYWVNGRYTSSDTAAKALLALARLSLDPDHSAVIVIYTPRTNGPAGSAATLDAFAQDMSGSVVQALREATSAKP